MSWQGRSKSILYSFWLGSCAKDNDQITCYVHCDTTGRSSCRWKVRLVCAGAGAAPPRVSVTSPQMQNCDLKQTLSNSPLWLLTIFDKFPRKSGFRPPGSLCRCELARPSSFILDLVNYVWTTSESARPLSLVIDGCLFLELPLRDLRSLILWSDPRNVGKPYFDTLIFNQADGLFGCSDSLPWWVRSLNEPSPWTYRTHP